MIIPAVLFLVTCFLAYVNGANDNFKGVATLFGSGTTDYRRAIWWATLTTFSGSVCSIFLAETLVRSFSGKGLVPDALTASPTFLLAVAAGAGLTVMLATLTGFPVSTTHSLTGALVGSGLLAVGAGVDFANLGSSFFLPLLFSPVISLLLGAIFYRLVQALEARSEVDESRCICIGEVEYATEYATDSLQPALALNRVALPDVSVDTVANCAVHYRGGTLAIKTQRALDLSHFISAGSVCFARGLNDTPKIVALLLVVRALGLRWAMISVALGMAVGGLLSARRVAETMSRKITPLTRTQGLTANLVTAALVIFASRMGMPVSTTHVSCGSLFGIGLITKQANTRVVSEILMSWLITLPVAMILGGAAYYILSFG
ncbi:MAG TPA: anion permease [Pyrinomonadaceae bacterium]|jgi:PiT family inorganic phosphate transporter|nr:anion permease [Pyrinomonadaceae bacterium]